MRYNRFISASKQTAARLNPRVPKAADFNNGSLSRSYACGEKYNDREAQWHELCRQTLTAVHLAKKADAENYVCDYLGLGYLSDKAKEDRAKLRSLLPRPVSDDDRLLMLRRSVLRNEAITMPQDYFKYLRGSDTNSLYVTHIQANFVKLDNTDYYLPNHFTIECECCNEVFDRGLENLEPVHTGHRGTESWCEGCTQNSSFYCDVSEARYSENEYGSGEVYNSSRTICTQIASDYGYEYCEEYDAYVHEDDEESRGGIPDYHCATRGWHWEPHAVFKTRMDRTFGVELEVEFPDSSLRKEFFNNHFRKDGRGLHLNFSAELDGSLSDEGGLEIIGHPFPLREYYAPNGQWAKMCDHLAAGDAYGWPVRRSYGMHITVDWREEGTGAWRLCTETSKDRVNISLARFEAFMLNNRALCTMVAGRASVYGGGEAGGYQKVKNLAEIVASGSKYTVMRRRDGTESALVEIRIFGANIRNEGIIRNVEFIDSLRVYVMRPDANLFAGAGSAHYRQWLLKPENATRWNYIARYLTPTPQNIRSLSIA